MSAKIERSERNLIDIPSGTVVRKDGRVYLNTRHYYDDLSESLRHKAEADEMLSAERKVHDNKTQGFCVKKQMYDRR